MSSAHEDLVREYAELEARTAPDLARMEEIKKYLRALDLGTHQIAGLKVTVARSARLDAAQAAELYPAEDYPELYKLVLDTAALKRTVTPATYEALQTQGDPRVTIK